MRMTSIASGSSGNCIYVGTDNTHIIVDAGISKKRVETGLNSLGITGTDIDGIFVTHEHLDHISGLGVFTRKYNVPIYATADTISAIKTVKSLGAIPDDIYREIKPDSAIDIKDIVVNPFSISHDAADPVAYRFESSGKSVGIATDLGKYDDYIIEHLRGVDVLLLEANHDVNMVQTGMYPYYLKQRILSDTGHLSNENAGRLLTRLLHDKLKKVFLGHLSKENNYAELAYETVRLEINMSEVPYKADDFHLTVAKRDQVSELIAI